MTTLAAVDLGASSGRVIAGVLDGDSIELTETARFANGAVSVPTFEGPRLHWDVLHLWQEILAGLRTAADEVGPLAAVGIDTWGVDYGLLDERGSLLGNPASYRCARTDGVPERLFAKLDPQRAYAANGTQVQPFNTIFQVLAERRLDLADKLLLLPDLFGYWLSGQRFAEVTNASTTGLLEVASHTWSGEILDALAIDFGVEVGRLLPALVEPGTVTGTVRPEVLDLADAAGRPTPLVAVGSHDTAAAVAAVPVTEDRFAYVSCGTWSLVGLELDAPVLTEAAREANFTNELGVDQTVRFLKNVMGLWVLNESVRTWQNQGRHVDIGELAERAAHEPLLRTIVDVNDPAFLAPGDMPARIAEAARRTGQAVPRTPASFTRCIIDSLAFAYRTATRQAARLSGRQISVVHMVGGGIKNRLLCQLTADATGLPVIAGPDEGTALGNLMIQARAVNAVRGDLRELRRIIANSITTTRFEPNPTSRAAFDRASDRMAATSSK